MQLPTEPTHSPVQPFDTTGLEPFPLVTPEGTLEKSAGPYLGIRHESRWRDRLHGKRMEGALHRTTSIPSWKTGSRSWPDHLRIFRHKLITNRLPTAAERHSRGDVEDDLPVPSTCPICSQHGSHITETQTHVLDSCPHIQHRHHIIERSINNTFRQFTQPTPIHTHNYDPYDQLVPSTDIEELDGWENTTTDKHGRSSTIAQGDPSYSILGQQFSQPWLRHIYSTPTTHQGRFGPQSLAITIQLTVLIPSSYPPSHRQRTPHRSSQLSLPTHSSPVVLPISSRHTTHSRQ